MSSNHNHKRDRIQIIADILCTCRSPQTQTYIRRQTCVSYAVLQSCLMQLRVRQWLTEVDGDDGLRKLAITPRGQEFLEKWFELQTLAGIKNKQLPPHRVYLRKDLQLATAN